MKNVSVTLVDYRQYTNNGDSFADLNSMYFDDGIIDPADPSAKKNSILGGFTLIPDGNTGNSKLVIEIVQAKNKMGAQLGFPDVEENIDQKKLDMIDLDIRTLVYGLRSLDFSEPTDILKNDKISNSTKGYAYDFTKPAEI